MISVVIQSRIVAPLVHHGTQVPVNTVQFVGHSAVYLEAKVLLASRQIVGGGVKDSCRDGTVVVDEGVVLCNDEQGAPLSNGGPLAPAPKERAVYFCRVLVVIFEVGELDGFLAHCPELHGSQVAGHLQLKTWFDGSKGHVGKRWLDRIGANDFEGVDGVLVVGKLSRVLILNPPLLIWRSGPGPRRAVGVVLLDCGTDHPVI